MMCEFNIPQFQAMKLDIACLTRENEELRGKLAAAEEDYAICNTQRLQADAANYANLDTIAELMSQLATARGLLREIMSGRESLVIDALGCELYDRAKKEVGDA